ncbi:ABC transporter ATP-binding protein [soil metagenome]
MADPIISLEGLTTEFVTPDGIVKAVTDVSYQVFPGETLGVVGESGSGKSVTVLSLLRLIPMPPGDITAGAVFFDGEDLLTMSKKRIREIRGDGIGIIFQDPMTSLNPVFTVGDQIAEAIRVHQDVSNVEAKMRTIELLEMVGVPNPDIRYGQHPHEYSGGMRQRALIAMAIANDPKLLIADEPTTALDVTIQAQVLEVLKAAQERTQAGMILITHDLGLIAEMADRVVVMYGGRVVEVADVDTLFHSPRHPYTLGLLTSLPRLDVDLERLIPISGSPPSLIHLPTGCAFHPRCSIGHDRELCRTERPPLVATGMPEQMAACHYSDEVAAAAEKLIVATEASELAAGLSGLSDPGAPATGDPR